LGPEGPMLFAMWSINLSMDGCSANLVIENQLDAAVGVMESVMAEVAHCGYDEHVCFGVRLALDEALINAIHHGNADDPQKHIKVIYSVDDEEVRISIEDEGPGFGFDSLPDPTAAENLEKPSGRGVLLMQAYMSQVQYNQSGNCVTLIKRRNCPLPV
jgi:serine/threonine-protein kinase RsbW